MPAQPDQESDLNATQVLALLPAVVSGLPAAGALASGDVVLVIQGGVAKKTTLGDINTFVT